MNTRSSEAQNKIRIRRQQIAEMRLSGQHNQARIAESLGVSPPTVFRDFQAIDALWSKEWADKAQVWKAQDAERIEALIDAIWAKATDPEVKSQNFYIDRVIALLDRRAKLLGLDAPTKLDITDALRRRALEEGLDPVAVVTAAEDYLKAQQV